MQRLGLERRATRWAGRIDEQPLQRLTDLFQRCATCCFEPGSHALVAGGSEGRRAFMDWGVFHVEREFLGQWRRYQLALRQRNVLLKASAVDDQFEPWEAEMARSGTLITRFRQEYVVRLGLAFATVASRVVPELDGPGIDFVAGWDAGHEAGLGEQLGARRSHDRHRLTSTIGAHRSDWRPRFASGDSAATLSRGQQKLVALSLVLAQASVFRDQAGEWPVMLFDDLPSELDSVHQELLLSELLACQAQCLITATELSGPMRELVDQVRQFHVERGVVTIQMDRGSNPVT